MTSIARQTVPASASGVAPEAALFALVNHEAELLDRRRFDEWLDLYTEDAFYWAPAAIDQRSPEDHVSLFYDDKQTMVARVTRLKHPEIHAQLPFARTCRLLTHLRAEPSDDKAGPWAVRSNLLMVEYRPGWEQRVFAGACRHVLREEGGRWRIARKRIDLINCDASFAALTLPF